jgi:hypothetical protein
MTYYCVVLYLYDSFYGWNASIIEVYTYSNTVCIPQMVDGGWLSRLAYLLRLNLNIIMSHAPFFVFPPFLFAFLLNIDITYYNVACDTPHGQPY